MITQVFEYNQHFVAMMNIINSSRLNSPSKGHRHHIIPRCWFKMNNLPVDNSKDNLVLLTHEDHLKVHKLSILCAATSEMKSKMGFAVKRLLKGNFSGMHHTDATKQVIKLKRAKQVITEEHKKHISESLKGKSKPPRTKSHREALSKSLTGYKWDKAVIEQRIINCRKAQKFLSESYHKYKDEGGELKYNQWLHNRKEKSNG